MSSREESTAFEDATSVPLSVRAMGERPVSYLDGLNPAQCEAVKTLDGPVLMLAGAGTGKTRALTTRIAHLINTGRARPNEILAVTFTNKAAQEMKVRVLDLIGTMGAGMPWLGTFHSVCAQLLRRNAELVGLKPNFTILDTDDQIRLLRQLIGAENIDEKRWPPRNLAWIINDWKNRALTPDRIPASEAAEFNNKGTDLYEAYQERLKVLNAVDFGDLLLHMVVIFQKFPDLLAKYQQRFRYILVDEYQDTDVAQYLWLRLLAAEHKNICCVGDDDQSIYGWRGAKVGNILRFEIDFPGAKTVRLEQNYRSTKHILGAASCLISCNKSRLEKTLWTDREGGEKLRLIGHWDGEEEARWVGEEMENYQLGTRGNDPVSLDGMAILVRASRQMRAFEERFLAIGLPYRVIGGPKFYERLEIRDAMAYFRVAVSADDGLAFERILNTPKRGLGDRAQQAIQVMSRSRGIPLFEAARIVVAEGGLPARAGASLGDLMMGFDRWSLMIRDNQTSHIRIAEQILEESGYTDYWQNSKLPDAPGRLENLKELIKALEDFDNLQGFLEHVSLIMEIEQESDVEKVTIMTLHGAKGLEFPVVFLPGWEEGLFPSQRTIDESGLSGLEEERRLAYVGITRAKTHCTISFASNRLVYGEWKPCIPSCFIDELAPDHVDVLTPPALNRGGFGAAASARPLDGAPAGSGLMDKASKANVYNSPGWQRMQARAALRGSSQDRDGSNLVIDNQDDVSYEMGNRVFHQKFGYGSVIAIEGDKLEISFEKAGVKKIVARFVTNQENDIPF